MNDCRNCIYLKYTGAKKFCTLSDVHQLEIKETKVICYSFTQKKEELQQLNLFT